MKKCKQIFLILIYSFVLFCGYIYLYPDFWKKFDEKIWYNFSEVLLYKIDLAAEKIKWVKWNIDSSINDSAPNTENTLEERINSIENAN